MLLRTSTCSVCVLGVRWRVHTRKEARRSNFSSPTWPRRRHADTDMPGPGSVRSCVHKWVKVISVVGHDSQGKYGRLLESNFTMRQQYILLHLDFLICSMDLWYSFNTRRNVAIWMLMLQFCFMKVTCDNLSTKKRASQNDSSKNVFFQKKTIC